MSTQETEPRPEKLEQRDAFAVRNFETRDESGVLDLLQAAFGKWPAGIEGVSAAGFFHWKLAGCPFGPPISIVAEAEGRVVGFMAMLPWLLRAGDRVVTTVRGVDLAVHPAHRRHGVSLAIIRAGMERLPVDAAFTWNNPNEHSRPGVLKSGRRQVLTVPRFVQLHRALRQTAWRAYGKGSNTPAELPVEAKTAAEILGDGAYVSRLLAHTERATDRLSTLRDLDYLLWRYGHFREYRAIRADEGHDPGIVIFRLRRHGSFWVSDVCELLVAHNDIHTARHLLHQVNDAAPVDFIRCVFPSRYHAAGCGFLQIGTTVLTTRPIERDLVPDPTQRASWALSLGDLELI
jgi:hypothetical protein